MTINLASNRVGPYEGNGLATSFAFTFKVFSASDLVVVKRNTDETEATLTKDVDYTVSLNANQNAAPGGSLTYPVSGSTLAADEYLTILNEPDGLQETDITNLGGFYPDVIENMADRATMLGLKNAEKGARSIHFSRGATDAQIASTRIPANTTSKYLMIGSTGLFELGELIASGVLSTSTIAEYLNPTEDDETNAGVTPTDKTWKIGHILRYGAALDGVTDDTNAVSDWLAVGQQGVTLFGAGGKTALVSSWSQVSVTANLHIIGNGMRIKGTASDKFIKPEGGGVDIRGIKFDTWAGVVDNRAADSGTTPYLILHGNRFENMGNFTVRLDRAFDMVKITENHFETLGADGASTYGILLGVDDYDQQDIWRRVIVANNTAKDISCDQNAAFLLSFSRDVVFEGNLVENVTSTSAGAHECWGIYTKSRYVAISNNVINNLTVPNGSEEPKAINVKGRARGESQDSPEGFGVSISGNMCFNDSAEGYGIHCNNEDISCVGNTITGFLYGIVCGQNNDQVIANNVIYCPNTTAGTYGINGGISGSNIIITGNKIYQGDYSIRFVCGEAVENWKIEGNVFSDPGTGGLFMANQAQVTNVSIQNNQQKGGDYFAVDLNFIDGLKIIGNQWAGLTAGNVAIWVEQASDLCTNVEIHSNSPFTLQTTDATVTNAFAWNIADNSAESLVVEAVGMESDGSDRAMYGVRGLFYRDGAGSAQEGSTIDQFTAIESDATWGGLTLDTSSNAIRARVQGVAAQTINWSVDVNLRTVH